MWQTAPFSHMLNWVRFFFLLSAFDVLLSFVSYADFHKRSTNNKVFSFCAFFKFSFLVTIFLFPGYCKAFVLKKKKKLKEKKKGNPHPYKRKRTLLRRSGSYGGRGEFGVRGDMAVTGGELAILIYGRAEVTFNKRGTARFVRGEIGRLMRFPGNTPTCKRSCKAVLTSRQEVFHLRFLMSVVQQTFLFIRSMNKCSEANLAP